MTEAGPAIPPVLELRMRVASGVVLIIGVVIAVVGPTQLFAVLVAAGAAFALREWHRLVGGGSRGWEAIPSIAAIVAVVGLAHRHFPIVWPLAAIAAGAITAAGIAMLRRSWVLWHAIGIVYLGIPALALVALREHEDVVRGGVLVGGVFTAVWAADISALFVGRLVGGPRLAPRLSPNKTWAGFLGGVAAAGLAEAIYVAAVGGAVGQGALFGVFLGIASHCGDLFESWVKRVFRTKNTGNLIPGHGGMLDRIDSLLFAAPAAAALLFIGGNEALFGPNP